MIKTITAFCMDIVLIAIFLTCKSENRVNTDTMLLELQKINVANDSIVIKNDTCDLKYYVIDGSINQQGENNTIDISSNDSTPNKKSNVKINQLGNNNTVKIRTQ